MIWPKYLQPSYDHRYYSNEVKCSHPRCPFNDYSILNQKGNLVLDYREGSPKWTIKVDDTPKYEPAVYTYTLRVRNDGGY